MFEDKSEKPDYDKSEDDKRALRYCIHLIAKRDYSSFKLSRKLKSKKYTQRVVDICLNKLIEMDYLREDNYIRMRILGIAKKGYGKRHIISKCREESLEIDEELIDSIFEEEELTEEGIFLYQLEKKTRNLNLDTMPNDEQYKAKQKVTRQLLARGFNFDLIKQYL